jgi:processive 1,2-diacylglycerol beta-glucosyltransferase
MPVLAYKIDKLLDDSNRMAVMRKNTWRIARPEAALDIVRKLLSLRNA